MNTIYRKRVWFKRKRTWIITLLLIGFGLFISTLPPELPKNVVYLVKGYSESEICEEALEIAKKHPKIVEILGELEPMGNLDLLNGYVVYSTKGDSVRMTIRIHGNKEIKKIHSKMDVVAYKEDENWKYHRIRVRIKQPPELKQSIQILD